MAVIGIGANSRATAGDVLAIIAAARATMAEGEPLIAAVATLSRATTDSILQEAADRAGLNLILLTLNELREFAHLCVTQSEQSMNRYGIPSIAEAAALAGAGAGARVLLPRFAGRHTTASVAGKP